MPPSAPPRLARLALAATLVHLAFDSVGRLFTATTPPYLLLPYMSEIFRDMLDLLGVNAISVGDLRHQRADRGGLRHRALRGPASAAPQARAAAVRDLAPHRGAMFTLYLSAPWPVALGSMAFGLPRAAALAWVLERMMARASEGPPTPAAP